MWLKAINVISQITIIILAVVIVITMSKKQMMDSTFSSFEAKINSRLDEDHKQYTDRINRVQDNLNLYQLNREQRAQLYSKRIDELYELYKKDPAPIIDANSSFTARTVAQSVTPVAEQPLDKNFAYLEQKINKVDEKVDTNNNRLESRLSILEQRVSLLNASKAESIKVIQNNLQTVNNGK